MSKFRANASGTPAGSIGKIEIIIDLVRDECTIDPSEFHLKGYNWLCKATRKKLTRVAESLLLRGAKVNVECDENPNNSPLHFAAKHGDLKIVGMLLERNADVHAKNGTGMTALHCAAVRPQNVEVIESLLRRGASAHARCNDGQTALHCAADLGSVENVVSLVSHGADVHARTRYGSTPFQFAVGSGNKRIVKYLVNFGTVEKSVCSSRYNHVDWKSLHFACLRGNKKLVESLLRKGAVSTEDMIMGLCVATVWKRAETVEILLAHSGVDVDARVGPYGVTVLEIAVENDDWKTLEHILQSRPDTGNENNRNCLRNALHQPDNEDNRRVVNALVKYGFTVYPEDAIESKTLHNAVRKGSVRIVEDLLSYGASVHLSRRFEDDFELLQRAARHRNPRIAKLLINHGIDVNTKVKNGNLSLILHAIEVNDVRLLKLLLSNGGNVKDTSDLVHFAVKSYRKRIIKIILNHKDIDINAVDKSGNTPLHYVVSPCNVFRWTDDDDENKDEKTIELIKAEIAELCLTRGANVDARTFLGTTPLHFAVVNGYENITRVLLFHNADVNCLSKGRFNRTALMEAVEAGNVIITRMLLENDAETSVKNEDEQTALHLACCSKNYKREVVESLILSGADLESIDDSGRTALHIAANQSRAELVRLLLSHGANINAKCYDGRTVLHCSRCDIIEMDNNCSRYPFGSPHRMAHVLSCGRCININFEGRNCNREHGNTSVPRQCVIDILARHIVQMKALGLFVSDENLRFIDLGYRDKDFYEGCNIECKILRDTRIGESSISFHDFLTKGPIQVAMSRKNLGTVRHPVLNRCNKIFPIYSCMIQHCLVQGQMRAAVFDASAKALNSLVKFQLPYVTYVELSSFLSNQDMTNLIRAAEPITSRVKSDELIPEQ